MTVIGISEKAQGSHPTRVSWLNGAGLETSRIEPCPAADRDARRILHVTELSLARHQDILIDFADGAPVLRRAKAGRPASVVFGFADMAFGHALIAEMIRPRIMPACGEPESAQALAIAARIARSDATVLLLGETGTGKEGVARYIHAASPRADKPFVAINCAALPETMLEAMLFGHQKGAFTGATGSAEGLFRAAEGGTLLLDEISELPLPLQAKMLRALQEREVLPVGATAPIAVDVRIVAAGNRDLATEVAAGRFRADLYWRLNVIPIELPSLRDRPTDIVRLGEHFLRKANERHKRRVAGFDPQVLGAFKAYHWPGNIRELENVVERMVIVRSQGMIGLMDVPPQVRTPRPASSKGKTPMPDLPEDGTDLRAMLEAVEDRMIGEALERTGGNKNRAAELLGLNRTTLVEKLRRKRVA